MTATLLVRPTAESSSDCRPVFHGHEGNRRLRDASGHRALDDGNQVIHLPDRALAEGFVSDPALPDAMSDSGVVGLPEIAFLEPSERLSF
jgi:hypothetical protein